MANKFREQKIDMATRGEIGREIRLARKRLGGVSKSMLKQSRLNFDKIEKCE